MQPATLLHHHNVSSTRRRQLCRRSWTVQEHSHIGIQKNWGYRDSKRHDNRMCGTKLMISVDVILTTFRLQINPKQNSVQSVMWPEPQHKMVEGQFTKLTKSQKRVKPFGVNCQPHRARFEQCSQLYCVKPRKIDRSALMEFLPSKAVMWRLTENERWRAIGTLQNGRIQLNVVRQFNVSQSVTSRQRNRNQQTGNVTYLPRSARPCFTTRDTLHCLATFSWILSFLKPPYRPPSLVLC